MSMRSNPKLSHLGAPHINVTLAIEDEPVHAPPTPLLMVAFGLSLIPIVGYIGAGLAGLSIFRQRSSAHGLAYAAFAITALYTILWLSLYLIVFRIPGNQSIVSNDPAIQAGQNFLLAVQNGDSATAQNLADTSNQQAVSDLLVSYRESIKYNPQNVGSTLVNQAKFKSSDLADYNGRPASFQLWRVSSDSAATHYFSMSLGQTATGDWKLVGVTGFDATSEATARTVAQQYLVSSLDL